MQKRYSLWAISVEGFKECEQTYANYVRTGRPLYKKEYMMKCKNIHKTLVSTRHECTWTHLMPLWLLCFTQDAHGKVQQTELLSKLSATNPCGGWLTSVRHSSRQHLQAKHVTLRRGPRLHTIRVHNQSINWTQLKTFTAVIKTWRFL